VPYQHLGASYESAVTDLTKFSWTSMTLHDNLKKQDFFNSSYFLDRKKGNWIGIKLGGHVPIFVAKSFVEGAQPKLCQLIGCAEVVGHSILAIWFILLAMILIEYYPMNSLQSKAADML